MDSVAGDQVVWHPDGHEVEVILDKHEVRVHALDCPFAGEPEADCRAPGTACVVSYFVALYGAECNVGVAPASPVMEIAWALIGDRRDMDACQLWFMPMADEAFSAWLGGFGRE